MSLSIIKWTDNDKQNLKKAINNFNSKIKRLEKLGYENLPEKISYKLSVKGRNEVIDEFGNIVEPRVFPILTRTELNRTLKNLRKFSERGQEEIIELEGGQKLTRWESNKIKLDLKRAKTNIEKEIKYINEERLVRGLGSAEKQNLIATKKSISEINKVKGSEFKRKQKLIEKRATRDRELRFAILFRENFMYALSEMKSYDNMEYLLKEIENIKNPIRFHEVVSKSEILMDLFLFYKEKATSRTYGGFSTNQEAFNRAISEIELYKRLTEENLILSKIKNVS